MVKTTLVFAALAIILGLVGFLGTGSIHATALIPAWIGLALGVGGFLSISSNERRRKLFMHINVTIGLVSFLGTCAEIIRTFVSSKPLDMTAMEAKLALAWLMFIYVILSVRSFLFARRSRQA